jgi:hypothetical protein
MQNEPPMNDPQTIWQNQNTEEMKMSLTQLEQKAKYHRARARRMVVANDLAYIALIVFLSFTFTRVPEHDIACRIGAPGDRLLLLGLSKTQATVAAIAGPGHPAIHWPRDLPARVADVAR